MTEALDEIPDAELIKAVRAGDGTAFAVLYERHLVAARRAAACLVSTQAEREDLVAEAFTRVLRMLCDGRGPDEEFRPYLLVTLRNTAISGSSRGALVSLYADVPETAPARGADDPVIDRWNASAAADAFASLPERWRVVLWHTEVENESPATVAPLLGMRPNSVAALAYRAREGLRQAYLRMHAPEPPPTECRPTVAKLAGYVRHNLPLPLSRKIGKHLTACAECRARAEALRKVNSELGGLLALAVLGAPLAAAYLPPAASAVTGALGATAVSGTAFAVASEVATTTGVLAMKATLVQVAAALAVTATAVTVVSSAPSVPEAAADRPAAELRLPAARAGVAPPGSSAQSRTAPPTPDTTVPPGQAGESGKAQQNAAAKAAKQAAKAAKQAAKSNSANENASASTAPADPAAPAATEKKPKKAKAPKKPEKLAHRHPFGARQ